MEWVNQLVGVPFRDHGENPVTGWDCYGLARWVLAERFGKTLPDLEYRSATDSPAIADLVDIAKPTIGAVKVETPEPGDLVLLAYMGFTCHVGVYLEDGMILHVSPVTGTIVEKMSSPRIARRIRGFYHVA